MAEPASPDVASDPPHSSPPMQEQVHTYRDVMGLIHWGGLAVGSLVLFLVLWFCTKTGLIPSVVLTAIAGGAGAFYFARKPSH